MKKLLIVLITLSCSLFASQADHEEVLSYSDFNVNDSVSLYAGKINMDYFLEDEAYSIGFLLHDNSSSHVAYGCGYIQPSSKFMGFTQDEASKIEKVDEDGVLFFINYNF